MRKFTFMWFIENYSFCWHEEKEKLVSPTFVAESIQGTSWNLQLYPRGDENEDFISLYLQRIAKCKGPEKVAPSFELSISDIKGRVFNTVVIEQAQFEFGKDKGFGSSHFCEQLESIFEPHRKVLARDTLKVCCTMWTGDGKLDNEARICARTRIKLEKISFIGLTENFHALKPNQKKTFHVKTASIEELKLSGYAYVKLEPGFEEELAVRIFSESEDIHLIMYQISLVNSVGKEVEFGKLDSRKYLGRKDILDIPLYFKMKNLLNEESEYLPNKNLILRCECIVSTGIEFQRIEDTFYDLHLTPFQEERLSASSAESSTAEPKSVQDDLKGLYKDQIACDVEVKSLNKTFPAHKPILCARSSVFRAMLTTNMKEKIMNSVKVDDLDDHTIDQFLLFLYTDAVEDLQWESAIKLYNAADKYNVQRLKYVCSSFLKSRLNTRNVSDLLILADRHQDFSLKTDVENFIFRNNKKIFCTEEWENFMEANPELAVKTMHFYLKNSSD